MDDYNVSVLSEAKNEYSTRLVNILTPLVVEGVKSIFDEAVSLCKENGEDEKYLMTFQNFLSRIPKWNSAIIDEECKRIVKKSGCSYLEDLLTCVHITQLKILTSIRVSSKQKKIDIEIPKLDTFVHKVYICFARKVYKSVYLFENNVDSLSYQKNMRECDILCKESVLEVIRDNMPVESILRAYMDETIEEDIIEETVEEIVNKKMEEDESVEKSGGSKDTESNENADSDDVKIIKKSTEEDENVEKDDNVIKVKTEELTSNDDKESKKENVASQIEQFKDNLELKIDEIRDTLKTNNEKEEKGRLTFNDNDNVLDMGTNKETIVEAPKTIDRLDKIQTERHEQRKMEDEFDDDDDDKLSIMDSVGLGDDDFVSLDKKEKPKKIEDDLVLDFEELN